MLHVLTMSLQGVSLKMLAMRLQGVSLKTQPKTPQCQEELMNAEPVPVRKKMTRSK